MAITDQGRIVAMDTPRNLIRSLKAERRLRFTAPPSLDLAA